MFRSTRNLILSVVSLLLLSLIGTGIYFYFQRNSSAPETFENPKIAVIPFTNLSPNSETDYLSLSFSDEIYKSLTSVLNCEVVRAKELKSDENLEARLNDLRIKSNVDLVIFGDYVVKENEIEINARLVDTFNRKNIYKQSFTVQNADISTIPVVISNSILAKLNLSGATMVNYLVNPANIKEEAYRNYLKAIVAEDRSSRDKSVELIKKALEIEPKFYSAWTLLATSYLAMTSDVNPTVDYYQKAIEAANKAKEIDPNNPQAGILLATIYTEQGKLEEALIEFKNLPKNNIDQAGRLRLGAYITRYGGLVDESIKLSKESLKFAPKTKIFEPQLYYAGDYEDFKRDYFPKYEGPSYYSYYLGLMALYENDPESMKKYFQDSRTFFEGQVIEKISQAIILHLDGKTMQGLQFLQEAEKGVNEAKYFDGENAYNLVIAYAYLGDKDGTIRALKKTIDNGFFCYPLFQRDPVLDKFRNDEKFQQVLETAHQKHLKFKEIYYSEASSTSD